MSTQAGRRELQFASLEEAVADARKLLASGYARAGNWNLAQVSLHLADWLRYPVEGYPRSPLAIRMMLAVMRVALGRRMLQKYLSSRSFPAGKPTMPATVHPAGEKTDAEAVEVLARAVERFQRHHGPWHDSPLFGRMSGDEHRAMQLVHCAHHLGFLSPTGG